LFYIKFIIFIRYYNFTLLNKFFYILFFTVIFTTGGFAQGKTGISGDASEKYIKVFPIPAVSVINFEFQKGFDKSLTIQVYNFIGKKVYDTKTTTPKLNIPLTDFYRGVYIYQLRDASGKIMESGKFQVIK
jgi:hypothetical protein